MKTINLRLSPRRWFDLSTPVAATITIFCLLAIAALVGRVRSDPSVAPAPTPSLPVIVIQKEQAPPAHVPAPPTPDQSLALEVAQLRARVNELEQQAAAPPPEAPEPPAQVIYVAAQEAPPPAVSTPEPPPEPTAEPIQAAAAPPPPPAVQASDFVQPDPKAACGVFVGCLPGR